MTLTIDDVIALRANCDDYVNAFKVLEQSKLDFQRAEDNLMSNLPAVGFRVTGQTNIDDLPTKLLVRLYTIAKKCGVGYFNYNTMPFDGNNANPLRAVYYAARLL